VYSTSCYRPSKGWQRLKTGHNQRHQLSTISRSCSILLQIYPKFCFDCQITALSYWKGRPFKWRPECNLAFCKLKQHLTTAPILVYPNFSRPFIQDTDASNDSIGAVLSQEYDGSKRVVAYANCTLSKSKIKYSVTCKELLAVVVSNTFAYIYWDSHISSGPIMSYRAGFVISKTLLGS